MNINALIRNGIAVLLLGLLMSGLAGAQTMEQVKNDGQLNIGFVQNSAPFSSAGTGGRAEGYSVDLCLRVADGLKAKLMLDDLKVNYVATTIKDGLAQVANGDIAMLCGPVTDTLARRASVSFSLPVFNGGIGVLIKEDAPDDLVRVLQGKVSRTGPTWRATVNQGLANHTYAVHEGTVTEEWVRERIATLRVTAKIVTVDDHKDGVEMVTSGDADAYFADRPILSFYSAGQEDLMVVDRYFTYEQIALVVPRGDEDLRLVADTVLSELYLSDEFADFYGKHFDTPTSITMEYFKTFALR